MQVIRDEILLCEDCTIAAVNGDYTGLDYHYGSEGADKRENEIETGLTRLGINLVPSFDSETGKGIHEFTWRGCDCCGSKLGGSRYEFCILG